MHSKTYSEIFDKDLMREYFNNEYELADVRKRTAVFFELWRTPQIFFKLKDIYEV